MNLEHCGVQDALHVRKLIHDLKAGKDGRKLRIKKYEYVEWYYLAETMFSSQGDIETGIRLNPEYHNTNSKFVTTLLYVQHHVQDKKYPRLNKERKLIFLKLVDDCFINLLAKLGYYPRSDGSKIIRIDTMHPVQFESTIKKLQREGYNLPKPFSPIQMKIEED